MEASLPPKSEASLKNLGTIFANAGGIINLADSDDEDITGSLSQRRLKFLEKTFPAELVNGKKIGDIELLRSAKFLDLGICRRAGKTRISFYPRGLPKVGNTVASFSRTTAHPDTWVLTNRQDVKAQLDHWNRISPPVDDPAAAASEEPKRLQSVEWTNKAVNALIKLR